MFPVSGMTFEKSITVFQKTELYRRTRHQDISVTAGSLILPIHVSEVRDHPFTEEILKAIYWSTEFTEAETAPISARPY